MKKSYIVYWLLVLGFCVINPSGAKAVKHVKVAVIGDSPRIPKDQEPQKLVEEVIKFWKAQLNQVLAARPDLIVLPEVCDRPGGMSKEEEFNYYRVRKDQVKEYFASVARENNCYIAFGAKREDAHGNWFIWQYLNEQFLHSNFILLPPVVLLSCCSL